MTIARAGQTSLFVGVPFVDLEHTKHGSVSVDNGAVHIDGDTSDHVISVKHTTGDGINILTATDKNTNAVTARIDSNGIVYCTNVVPASGGSLADLDNIIAAATALDPGTGDTLVMRDQSNGTEIDNLHVIARTSGYSPSGSYPPAGLYFTQGTCSELAFQPYDNLGDAITGRTFSFGRAMPLAGPRPTRSATAFS